MADNKFELDIYLHELPSEETRDKESLKETTSSETKEKDGKELMNNEKSKKAAKQFAYNAAQVVQYATHLASQEINFRISRHATMYGDTARANKLTNEMNTFNTAKNAGAAIVAGFTAGGPVGGIIAIAGTALTMAQDVSQRLQLFEDKQEDHLLNSAYAQERLGMITASKGR